VLRAVIEGKTKMGSFIGTAIGALLAAFGFLVMWNPMRLALLAPGARGYYQRIVLETSSRNQLRILGALVCTFGLCISTSASGELLRSHVLLSISDGFVVLLWVVFISAWVAGVILAIVHFAQGRGFGDWFQMWRKTAVLGAVLGEVNIYPPVTPKMRREAILSTIIFGASLCITIIAALLSGR
jgi:hypothetical protein